MRRLWTSVLVLAFASPFALVGYMQTSPINQGGLLRVQLSNEELAKTRHEGRKARRAAVKAAKMMVALTSQDETTLKRLQTLAEPGGDFEQTIAREYEAAPAFSGGEVYQERIELKLSSPYIASVTVGVVRSYDEDGVPPEGTITLRYHFDLRLNSSRDWKIRSLKQEYGLHPAPTPSPPAS